jgi:signal transduction histidine kinase
LSFATATLAADEGGELLFRIVDDGRGFDTSVTDYGTGLQGMADRLDAVGGTLDVRSEPARARPSSDAFEPDS